MVSTSRVLAAMSFILIVGSFPYQLPFLYSIISLLFISKFLVLHEKADLLLNACRDIGLAVHTGKTKYMEIGRHQGMVENEHIRTK